jgi:DHA2 family multidrug resistance protein-like MFS transporter
MIAPYAGAVVFVAPAAGMLSDKLSPQWLGIVGLGIATVAAATFAFLPDAPTYLDVAWRAALCGVGFSLFFSPNGRLMIASAPRDRVAGASSLLSTTRMFGQALGSVLLSGLLTLGLGSGAPALVAAGLAALALGCAVVRLAVSPD